MLPERCLFWRNLMQRDANFRLSALLIDFHTERASHLAESLTHAGEPFTRNTSFSACCLCPASSASEISDVDVEAAV